MDCCECQSRIDLYLAGILAPGESEAFNEHISTCQHCRDKVVSYKYVNQLIIECDVTVPQIDITKAVMEKIRNENAVVHRLETVKRKGIGHQRLISLWQDLVAAAAAAMIILWLTGPVLEGTDVSQYSQKVSKVNNSVGMVFEGYLNFYDRAIDKFIFPFDEIHRWK